MYTGEHELGNGLYMVEIYLDEKDSLGIDATHKERNAEKFLILEAKPRSKEIEKEFDSDFYMLAEHLRVMNKRMVLLNKVSFNFHLNFSSRWTLTSWQTSRAGMPPVATLDQPLLSRRVLA